MEKIMINSVVLNSAQLTEFRHEAGIITLVTRQAGDCRLYLALVHTKANRLRYLTSAEEIGFESALEEAERGKVISFWGYGNDCFKETQVVSYKWSLSKEGAIAAAIDRLRKRYKPKDRRNQAALRLLDYILSENLV